MNHPTAKFITSHGVITIELFPEYAPNSTASFIWAAQQGYYKNRLIKRVVPGFVVQPSYSYFEDDRCKYHIEGEFASNGFENNMPFVRGTVALAGDGDKEASGCEFFITLTDETGEKLAGRFAPFGQVTDGWTELDRLAGVPVKQIFIEGVGATIMQPVKDEYLLDVEIDTHGTEYPQPQIKRWVK